MKKNNLRSNETLFKRTEGMVAQNLTETTQTKPLLTFWKFQKYLLAFLPQDTDSRSTSEKNVNPLEKHL
jgi:hypothetical protein